MSVGSASPGSVWPPWTRRVSVKQALKVRRASRRVSRPRLPRGPKQTVSGVMTLGEAGAQPGGRRDGALGSGREEIGTGVAGRGRLSLPERLELVWMAPGETAQPLALMGLPLRLWGSSLGRPSQLRETQRIPGRRPLRRSRRLQHRWQDLATIPDKFDPLPQDAMPLLEPILPKNDQVETADGAAAGVTPGGGALRTSRVTILTRRHFQDGLIGDTGRRLSAGGTRTRMSLFSGVARKCSGA